MELSSEMNGKHREMDQESAGSSDDTESPRSVVGNKMSIRKWPDYYDRNNNNNNNKSNAINMCVHSQILRIREEDSHIGEDSISNPHDHPHNYHVNYNRMVGSVECRDDHNHITSNNKYHHHHHHHHHVDMWIISHRSILPASPLSGKPITSQFH